MGRLEGGKKRSEDEPGSQHVVPVNYLLLMMLLLGHVHTGLKLAK